MEKRIVILGAGGTGLVIAESTIQHAEFTFYGFLDDDKKKQSNGYFGYSVFGSLSDWDTLPNDCYFLNSLFGPKNNEAFANLIRSLKIPKDRWATLIHPKAVVSGKIAIGVGTYVGPGVIINPEVNVGCYCALMANMWIGHHSRIEDHVFLSNSLSVSGGVSIGCGSYLGSNATIREYTKIGSYSTIGMGSVVVCDVGERETVVGNPARKLG